MSRLDEALKGGPGLDGYAYQADVYCVDCGQAITCDVIGYLKTLDDLYDPDVLPQPIFFGESDRAQHCADCGEYLYGDNEAP